MIPIAVTIFQAFFVKRTTTSLWRRLFGLSLQSSGTSPTLIVSLYCRVFRYIGIDVIDESTI